MTEVLEDINLVSIRDSLLARDSDNPKSDDYNIGYSDGVIDFYNKLNILLKK